MLATSPEGASVVYSGNTASITFTVTVVGAEGQSLGLRDVDLPAVVTGGPATALAAHLTVAIEALRRGNTAVSCRLVKVFIQHAMALNDQILPDRSWRPSG